MFSEGFTEEELSTIEEAFGFPFCDEERAILNCFDATDIQACPGGGKTTVLVAKLLLLEKRLPLPEGKGICVLTHTNVGIDEIRTRASSSDRLFADPNFCGTIQSFVDRFLGIPAYVSLFHKRPTCIDADLFDRRMDREYRSRFTNANRRLFPPATGKSIEREQEIWRNLRFEFDGAAKIFTDGLGGDVIAKDPSTDRYKAINSAKMSVMSDGILHFDDAYSLANFHLNKFPELVRLFRSRFGLVFIDEMQDTAPHQISLLERLFDGSLVQRFGDMNQAIYEIPANAVHWEPRGTVLSLSHSKRLPALTASVIRHVCHVPHDELGGHDDTAIKPTILVFDDADIGRVLPTFGELIRTYGVTNTKHPFKAVGRVGRPNTDSTKHSIVSYFPSYRKEGSISQQPRTLRDFLQPDGKPSAAYYQTGVFQAFSRVLYLSHVKTADRRYYSAQRLRSYLSAQHPVIYSNLTADLVRWCRDFHAGIDRFNEVEAFIRDRLLPLFSSDTINADVEDFLILESRPAPVAIQPASATNRFIHAIPDQAEIEIELATVHSVKGETHTATLYLETFFHQYDIWQILDVITGESKPVAGTQPYNRLPIAYVAMTRPTTLLAMALHRTNGRRQIGSKEISALEAAGWEVISI